MFRMANLVVAALLGLFVLQRALGAPCLLDDFESSQPRRNPRTSAVVAEPEETNSVLQPGDAVFEFPSTAAPSTTTESIIKKAAKNLAESFHKMSSKINENTKLLTTRNGRSGILRLPGDSGEDSDWPFPGIRLPPPININSIRDTMRGLPTLPTLPSLFKPTPPMHTIGISGLLSDGNLHELARGR